MQEKTIGEKIREYRQKLGLTQDALASELHISSQAISKWETGQTMPDINLLLPLSKVLEIGVNELLGGDRREELEREWQKVCNDEELALLVAREALKEFPDDETFLYRRACDEYFIGTRKEITKAKAYEYKNRAIYHFSELHRRFPDNDTYTGFLARVYFSLGENERALELAYTLKDSERRNRDVAEYIGGDEEIRYKQKELKASMEDLYSKLLRYNTRESITAAYALIELLQPEDKKHRCSYWHLLIKFAELCLEDGDTEGFVKNMTLAYDTMKACDALPREPIKYTDPLFDRLQDKRDLPPERFGFPFRKLAHPSLVELRRRAVDEHVTYHRFWRHEWMPYFFFCRELIGEGAYFNFSMRFNLTAEEEENGWRDFARKHDSSREAKLAYYKQETERLVGGGIMHGFAAYGLANRIVAYCNCWNKESYVRLPVPDEYRSVPEGEKVFSIVEVLTAKHVEDCGVEEKLLETALEYAKSEGYTCAEAYIVDLKITGEDVARNNELAALYEKLGFVLAHDLSEDGKRKYILRKTL